MSIAKMQLFYSDSCPACRNFKPVWEKLKQDMTDNNIQFQELDCQKDMASCEIKKISTIPHLEVTISDGTTFKYTNSRDYPDLRDFILSNNVQQGGAKPKGKSIRYHIKYIN